MARMSHPNHPFTITHSQSSNEVDRNREYKIRRTALGEKPTKEEMDAVITYRLEQHKISYPNLKH